MTSETRPKNQEPGKWEIVACQSGFTLREVDSGQLMHSRLGAWEEANQIYVAQSELDRRASTQPEPLVLYDVGLGIAANSVALADQLKRRSSPRPLQIYSFEKHPAALAEALEAPQSFPFLENWVDGLRELTQNGFWRDGSLNWTLLRGDFQSIELSALPPADLVYFDFYAPGVCPQLWGTRIFSKLYPKMNDSGLLITYAATKFVRSALLLSGFYVGEGVATPMKNQTTVAARSLAELGSPLQRAWLDRLEKSERPLPSDWPERRREEMFVRLRSHPQFATSAFQK